MRKGRKRPRFHKVVDEVNAVRSLSGSTGVIREEVWRDAQNRIVRYNLAYINHAVCHTDNGRVLGYDNAHGYHERHCMGVAEEVNFTEYDQVIAAFLAEVQQWRAKT